MVVRAAVALSRKLLAGTTAAALADTFKALGDVTRVRMLDALSRSELCVSDLAEILGLTESAVSHQLRLLRGMRLVRPRRDGRLVYYALDDDHIERLFAQGLEHVEEREGRIAMLPAHRPGARRSSGHPTAAQPRER